ncbi:hypothetical protein [Neptunomonas antarctica]|uniref:Uncharacterized protein n=1 Tax=Neptunomonas antarctica TaxID=619304 RepID=A0A1N7NY67_9GAMM|nr:hypothetical protein [Neptunomonas antarctica]SIT03226.1 hypothetical protein SAMN05421760_111143 [Neptunomonas antarctica]
MKQDKYYIDRKFETIFRDSIYFTKSAFDALENENNTEEQLARAAILNLSILPEVVANCLLETLNLPKNIFNEVDKFTPINKYDFFLWEKKNLKLDRGLQEIQNIQELQSIRNFMVHPKSKKAEWVTVDEFTRTADLGKTKLLEIPYSSDEWQGDDPFIVMRVVMAFFDHIFRVLCEYTPGETQYLLFNTGDNIEGHQVGYFIDSEWKKIQEKWSLRMRFLGVDCTSEKNI